MISFSDWSVSGYEHVFVLLSVVIVTLPSRTGRRTPAATTPPSGRHSLLWRPVGRWSESAYSVPEERRRWWSW